MDVSVWLSYLRGGAAGNDQLNLRDIPVLLGSTRQQQAAVQ